MNSIQNQILQQQLLKSAFRQHKVNAPSITQCNCTPPYNTGITYTTTSTNHTYLDLRPGVKPEEAEVFVVKMWRLLIYELEAKKLGLMKWCGRNAIDNISLHNWWIHFCFPNFLLYHLFSISFNLHSLVRNSYLHIWG